jgi:hypothetical protein
MARLRAGENIVCLATIFLSAFLLFQVQPVIARYLLPWFGGSPAVWNTCLLFFQALLLCGYFYAHKLRARWIHLILLVASLLFLPAVPRADVWGTPAPVADPTGRILLLLLLTVGVPYFTLSATAPLLQRWVSLSAPETPPWRLYALSNLGSFLALLSYPFLIEPYLPLKTQSSMWAWMYGLFAVLCALTAGRVGPAADAPVPAPGGAAKPRTGQVLFWLGLSAAGSTLLLAATNQISQEIAVNPFLWVAPLSVYLLSFVLTFESQRWYKREWFAVLAGLGAAAACAVTSAAVIVSWPVQLAVYLGSLFLLCMICHGELFRSRPEPQHLTSFYLTVAAGGVLGGIFVALLAPHIFTEFTEYPIGLAAACLLGLVPWLSGGRWREWTSGNFAMRIAVMALLLGGISSIADAVIEGGQPAVFSARNFYGILRVSEHSDANGPYLDLTHGRTIHGLQYLDPAKRDWPTTYYGPHTGIAMALQAFPAPRRIAVIGLGTGTLAVWGRTGDTMRFYEINPAVVSIAETRFTFLKDSKAGIDTVLGDARVQMEREHAAGKSHDYDVIAVDAFASDTIPVHLLTAECADLYANRLAPGGMLLLHISNRVLDLEPVARGIAQHLGWHATQFVSSEDEATGERAATWVLMTPDATLLDRTGLAAKATGWTDTSRRPLTWTDDFASLWHVLKR